MVGNVTVEPRILTATPSTTSRTSTCGDIGPLATVKGVSGEGIGSGVTVTISAYPGTTTVEETFVGPWLKVNCTVELGATITPAAGL